MIRATPEHFKYFCHNVLLKGILMWDKIESDEIYRQVLGTCTGKQQLFSPTPASASLYRLIGARGFLSFPFFSLFFFLRVPAVAITRKTMTAIVPETGACRTGCSPVGGLACPGRRCSSSSDRFTPTLNMRVLIKLDGLRLLAEMVGWRSNNRLVIIIWVPFV